MFIEMLSDELSSIIPIQEELKCLQKCRQVNPHQRKSIPEELHVYRNEATVNNPDSRGVV
jgi:hypothetical protein